MHSEAASLYRTQSPATPWLRAAPPGTAPRQPALYREQAWRQPGTPQGPVRGATIVASRWIESAKAMLTGTGAPLVEVALGVGFRTQSHVSTVFKRLAGETPAKWQRTRRAEFNGKQG